MPTSTPQPDGPQLHPASFNVDDAGNADEEPRLVYTDALPEVLEEPSSSSTNPKIRKRKGVAAATLGV